jgi:hypothetical protein
VVYSRLTNSNLSSVSTNAWLARRGGATWTQRDVLGPNVRASSVVPVGTGYIFLGTSVTPASTGTNPWYSGYAYWCAGPQCPAGACGNGLQDGRESDVDCGGGTCADCSSSKACLGHGDCTSNTCSNAVCP